MRALAWIVMNVVQATFTVSWTLLCVLSALVVLVLTLSRSVPLLMARRVWATGLLWAARARLEITGLEHVDFTQPHVFVSNHESTIDIPVIFRALPVNLHFIIKKELKYVPLIGWYAWAMGMIFVDRRDKMGAFSSLKKVGRLIRSGRNIIAFPEGTRSRSGEVLPFKKGVFVAAAEAGVPIVPVAITGAAKVMPAASFRIRPGVIKVAIGRPILTGGASPPKRGELPELVRAAVTQLHRGIST